jgi:hypothetical protein
VTWVFPGRQAHDGDGNRRLPHPWRQTSGALAELRPTAHHGADWRDPCTGTVRGDTAPGAVTSPYVARGTGGARTCVPAACPERPRADAGAHVRTAALTAYTSTITQWVDASRNGASSTRSSIPAVATAGQHLHARGAGQGMVCGDHALRRHDLVLAQRERIWRPSSHSAPRHRHGSGARGGRPSPAPGPATRQLRIAYPGWRSGWAGSPPAQAVTARARSARDAQSSRDLARRGSVNDHSRRRS